MVAAAREAFGAVDVLHNCAATIEFAPAAELTLVDYWRRVVDTNSLGTRLAGNAMIPAMLEDAGARS